MAILPGRGGGQQERVVILVSCLILLGGACGTLSLFPAGTWHCRPLAWGAASFWFAAACSHPSAHSSLGAPGSTLTSCLPARLALLTVLPCPGLKFRVWHTHPVGVSAGIWSWISVRRARQLFESLISSSGRGLDNFLVVLLCVRTFF